MVLKLARHGPHGMGKKELVHNYRRKATKLLLFRRGDFSFHPFKYGSFLFLPVVCYHSQAQLKILASVIYHLRAKGSYLDCQSAKKALAIAKGICIM